MPMKETGAAVMADQDIIALYWKRDENAIRETDRKYKNYLRTVAWNILADNGDCEECLSDTYLHTWNTIPPTRPQFFAAFLAKITRHLAIDRRRAAERSKRVPAASVDSLSELADTLVSGESPEASFESATIAVVLNRYLRTLSDRDLDLFISRYFESDPVANIARRAKMSASGVRKALERMREDFRQTLEKEGIHL